MPDLSPTLTASPQLLTEPITWDFPLPRTHTGIALGNGVLGCLVWGEQRLHLTVNRADHWDRRGGSSLPNGVSYRDLVNRFRAGATKAELDAGLRQKRPLPFLPWNSSRLPCGRFELSLRQDLTLHQARLQTDTGVLTITAQDPDGTLYQLELAMDMGSPIMALADPDGIVVNSRARSAWEWNAKVFTEARFEPAEMIDEPMTTSWLQALPDDPALAALLSRVPGGLLLCLEQGKSTSQARVQAEATMQRCRQAGWQTFYSKVASWWRAYWHSTPQIDLPDPFYNRFYRYALFRFAGATTPEATTPAGLQGPWVEEYQHTPWGGDYHFNVNIQQIYTLAFPLGRPQHLMPLFDMLESPSFQEQMRQNARRLLDIEDGLLLPHAVNDRGKVVGGGSLGSILDPACGGWTAQLYWLYFRYTGDLDFLRHRALPFLRGVMNVYQAMLEKCDDRYHLPLAVSAEYQQPQADGSMLSYGTDPSVHLACIHMLLDALLQAVQRLDQEPEPAWLDIKEKLPPFTCVDDRIAIWEGQDLDLCHRHHSHLSCLYPFDTLGEMDPETKRIVDNSIDHWIARGMGAWSEWCYPWAAILQARMGFRESPRALLDIWRRLFINEGLATVYLPRFPGLTSHRRQDAAKPLATSEIMQLDGTMAGATALVEMLVHQHQGITRLFPAVPADWPDVSFRRICLPGPVRISAAQCHGRLHQLCLEAEEPATLHLEADAIPLVRLDTGEPVRFPCTLTLAAGQTVRFEPS